MALVQIEYPANLTTQADFSAHGDLIEAGLWDKVNNPLLVQGGNIPQGAVLQIGSVIFHGTTATAITGTASDYVQVTDNGDGTASAAYIATLTGVTWSAQYNGYYDGSGRLYLFDEGKALAAGQIASVFGRYLMQQANGDVAVGRDLAVKRNAAVTGTATVSTLGVTGVATLASASVTGNITAATATARGFDTFGGFYQGTNVNATDLPVGSIVPASKGGAILSNPQRNEIRTIYTKSDLITYVFNPIFGALELEGVWRSRGPCLDSNEVFLFQRTA